MNSMGGYKGFGGMPSGNKIPKGYSYGQFGRYTPQQTRVHNQAFGLVSPDSYTSRLAHGDEDLFNEMEAPAMRQFQGILGGLASRFSGGGGAGSLSNRRSSGFQNTTSQAASDFSQDLASKRQAYQRQAIMDLMGLSNDLLEKQRPYEQFLVEKQKKPSAMDRWAQFGGTAIGAGARAFAGGF